MKALQIRGITKAYGKNIVIKDFDLDVEEQEFVCIIGESGCGKSTLLNMIGELEKPDQGTITYFDKKGYPPYSRGAEKLLRYEIGYLFQNFALVDDESVYRNLEMALTYQKGNKKDKIMKALEEVGLSGFENKKVYQCSGGEQQRIAIARLLLKPCRIILADEPTGSLDLHNKQIVMELLKKMKQSGKTIIVVTHDKEVSEIADRVLTLTKLTK